MGKRRVLTFADRMEISTGCKAGWTVRRIAAHVGRCPSMISREIRRNQYLRAGYQSVHADCQAERRRARPQVCKVAADPVLEARVLADVKRGRSPRAIAGRVGAEATKQLQATVGSPDGHARTVSHEAVYTYIYAMPRSELVRHGIRLDSKRTHRRPRKTPGQRNGPIVGMVSIDERPDEVDDRKVLGSWEGDLIITHVRCHRGGDAGRAHHTVPGDPGAAQGTWVRVGGRCGHRSHRRAARAVPQDPDVGPGHRDGPPPLHPKSTPITDHQPYLDAIAEELNEIPREFLDWRTPREAYEQLLAHHCCYDDLTMPCPVDLGTAHPFGGEWQAIGCTSVEREVGIKREVVPFGLTSKRTDSADGLVNVDLSQRLGNSPGGQHAVGLGRRSQNPLGTWGIGGRVRYDIHPLFHSLSSRGGKEFHFFPSVCSKKLL